MDTLAERVAIRHLLAQGEFKVGDPILYGKYKNKRGIIVRLFDDEKGHPTLEVEPVPKGRKQNKLIGLYKIWHDPNPPEPDEEAKTADLHPPLGKPGGPCQVIQRIEKNVHSPALKGDLVEDVNHGQDLTNQDASKVYPILREHGVGPIRQVQITSHGQYRMDLRGITVDDVRRAIGSFLQQMGEWKAKKNPAYERMGQMLERGEKLEWVDPKTSLKVVLAPTGGGSVTLVSTFWKGRPDPPPPQGACALPRAARFSPSTEGSSMDKLASAVVARFETEAAKYKKKVETDKGNTVYTYSDRQVAQRNKKKAQRIEALRKSIGDLRRKMKRDIKSSDPEKAMVALAVALIDHTYERVGNEDSAGDGHYGVTGWKKKHVTFGRGTATIRYTGKAGVKQEKKVTDLSLKQALREAYEACDKDNGCLFEGEWGSVTADKVNDYLEPFDITAKDIRGFHANREMQTRLKAMRADGDELPRDKKEKAKVLKAEFLKALDETAEAVGHEASTLRSQYLIPGLEEQYLKNGTVSDKMSSVLEVEGVAVEERLAARALFDLL